jgi:zinc transport system permease protein
VDFLAPLQFEFMQRALLAGVVIAVIAPAIGTFLVMRRYAYMADTLAHVSLVGVALGLLFGVSPIIGAIVIAVIAALGIERLRVATKLFTEATLALFLSGSLAIAAVLLSLGDGFSADLFSFLFGSITTVSPQDVWTIVIVGLVVCVVLLLLYKSSREQRACRCRL